MLRTHAPVVGDLTRHVPDQWLFAVRVPVVRAGVVTGVVSALVTPENIRGVLTRQNVPGDWVISIVDASGLRVARSRAHEENLAGRLSDTAQQVVNAGGDEGFGVSRALEGDRIFTPYARLPAWGWIAVLGIPTALVDAAAYRALAFYGGGILLSIALGTLGGLWVARTITRPIGELRTAAEAMGRRKLPSAPATSIQEIRDVGIALRIAADDLTVAAAEREDLLRKERVARETAESADRAKDEFMAVLSHELRTPLNAVYGWARMLQSGQLADRGMADRATNAIVRNADMQVQLIDDLLDLSRITSGKLRLQIGAVDLRGVLGTAVDAIRPAADAKGIRIETDFAEDVPIVRGDPSRLQQVAWNLLMNAVKFTPGGGEVRLELHAEGAQVRIVVRDTGQGITPDILPHVFERFRQADSSSTRPHGGLGLGLTLVKHLVELHGGAVTAESAGQGRGATFTVTLPVAGADVSSGSEPAGQPAHASLTREATAGLLRGVRVLVVDDDSDGLVLAEAILAGAGAEVRTCSSAAVALDLVRTWLPDVLVSDIEMPGEDGYTLIRRVRALPREEGGEIPAVALTAYGRAQDRVRSLAEGYTMHVPKPVDPGELTDIVAGLVDRAAS